MLEFEIRTDELQKLIGKVKSISDKKVIIDILNGIEVKTKDGRLVITGTDSVNFVEASTKDVDINSEGRVIVDAKRFISLVQSTTKSKIKFKETDKTVELKGNGNYKIEMKEEEDYKFPQMIEMDDAEVYTLNTITLQNIVSTLSAAISKYVIHDYVDGYILSKNGAYSTDMVRFMKYGCNILEGDEMIGVPTAVMDYVKLFSKPEIKINRENDNLLFEEDGLKVFCKEVQEIEKFPPYETIVGNLNLQWEGEIPTKELLNAINRLMIFTDDVNGSIIILEVQGNKVVMYDRQNKKAVEGVEVKNTVTEGEDVIIGVDAEIFIPILKSMSKEVITLKLGNKNPIMVIQDNVEGIVAPFLENNDEGED